MLNKIPTLSASHAGGQLAALSLSRLQPRDEALPAHNLQASRDVPAQAKDKPRVLVVDDAPDVTEMIALLLNYSGYDAVTFFCAPDALDAARGEHFDVIVSDIGMPGMTGYELAVALRALPDYASVPMVAVTGFAMYDDRERALESGFNAFLTKPINPMDLIDVIKNLRS
ncbi:MAG TPA: response regulator [Pyrinomonadaceae bacterium]|jgi:two-component system CheB/CheR fusion protein|nr:response regulator [Pyrinomonadaceae bacterium]